MKLVVINGKEEQEEVEEEEGDKETRTRILFEKKSRK